MSAFRVKSHHHALVLSQIDMLTLISVYRNNVTASPRSKFQPHLDIIFVRMRYVEIVESRR